MTDTTLSEGGLRELEARYCSHGDTVHYLPDPEFFERCEGSFLYDREGREFLDLQMWYSAVNFGYRNGAPERGGACGGPPCCVSWVASAPGW